MPAATPARAHPALTAELAWRDSSFTHYRTGIYASMGIASAIAAAFVDGEPMEIFDTAMNFIPRHCQAHEPLTGFGFGRKSVWTAPGMIG